MAVLHKSIRKLSRRSALAVLCGILASGFGRRSLATGAASTDSDETPALGTPSRVVLDGSSQADGWLRQNVGPCIGRIRPRPAVEIAASPFSVGMETLDRRMFDPQRTYDALAALGVKWARLQTGWARTELRPGEYDFAWLEEVVDNVRRRGVQPWFNLGYGNRLYQPDAPDDSAVGWVPIYSEEAARAWLRFTAECARRFRTRVRYWEIWNEPNITNFWKPAPPSAEKYVQFVAETAAVIRREIPDAIMIGGALAGMPTEYLKLAIEHGLLRHVDKISYHPYRPIPEKNYRTTLETWRNLLAQHSDNDTPPQLWQGENGCPSKKGSAGALSEFEWTEIRQAKWLLRRMLYDVALGLELTSYFHMVDLVNYNWGEGPTGRANYKGLLRGDDYSPKPAYPAYQHLCALFDRETTRVQDLDSLMDIQVWQDPAEQGAKNTGNNTSDLPEVEGELIGPFAFIRKNWPVWVFWRAASLFVDAVPQFVKVQVRTSADAPLRQPVLLDPLSGLAYKVAHGSPSTSGWTLEQLLLADYPLILTDFDLIRAMG